MMLCKITVLTMFITSASAMWGRGPPKLPAEHRDLVEAFTGFPKAQGMFVNQAKNNPQIWVRARALHIPRKALVDVLKCIEPQSPEHITAQMLIETMEKIKAVDIILAKFYNGEDDQARILRTGIWRKELNISDEVAEKYYSRVENALQYFCEKGGMVQADNILRMIGVFIKIKDDGIANKLKQMTHNRTTLPLLWEKLEGDSRKCFVQICSTSDSATEAQTKMEIFLQYQAQMETIFVNKLEHYTGKEKLATKMFKLAKRHRSCMGELLDHYARHVKKCTETEIFEVMADLERIMTFVARQTAQDEIRKTLFKMYVTEKDLVETVVSSLFSKKIQMTNEAFEELVATVRMIVKFANPQEHSKEIREDLCRLYTTDRNLMDNILLLCRDETGKTTREFKQLKTIVEKVLKKAADYENEIKQQELLRKVLYKCYTDKGDVPVEDLEFYNEVLEESKHFPNEPDFEALQTTLKTRIKVLEEVAKLETEFAITPTDLMKRVMYDYFMEIGERNVEEQEFLSGVLKQTSSHSAPDLVELQKTLERLIKMIEKVEKYLSNIGTKHKGLLRKSIYHFYTSKDADPKEELDFLRALVEHLEDSECIRGLDGSHDFQAALEARIEVLDPSPVPEPEPAEIPQRSLSRASSSTEAVLTHTVLNDMGQDARLSTTDSLTGAEKTALPEFIHVLRRKERRLDWIKTLIGFPPEWEERSLALDHSDHSQTNRIVFGIYDPELGNTYKDCVEETEGFHLAGNPMEYYTDPKSDDEVAVRYLELSINQKTIKGHPLGEGFMNYFSTVSDGKLSRFHRDVRPKHEKDWNALWAMCKPTEPEEDQCQFDSVKAGEGFVDNDTSLAAAATGLQGHRGRLPSAA